MRDVAWLFLKLGTIAFGGPAAHIAMMEQEVVSKRAWMSREQFLDLVGATNLIPGPNSTELAIHIGYSRAGLKGLIIAGTCFILPATIIVSAIAWAYVRFGALPQVNGLLYGIKPVVVAIIAQAIWKLGRSAIKTRTLALVAIASVVAAVLGANELIVLAAAAMAMAALKSATSVRALLFLAGVNAQSRTGTILSTAQTAVASATQSPTGLEPFAITTLFFTMIKAGAVLFGSGYVLIAFLRADFVQRLGWLTETQLLDAIAVGQATPGPVFTTATFVGYVLAGGKGALVATLGIFLPAFVFVAMSAPIIPRLRQSPVAGALLDGVNVASLAIMTVVTVHLARVAVIDLPTIVLALSAAIALLRWQVNSAWLVLAGAAVGLAGTFLMR